MAIAVLFADKNSVYKTLPGFDVYDMDRDALTYPGGQRIIAHPPCHEYSRAKLKRTRRPEPFFAFTLDAVRRDGGVIEHPSGSAAFMQHGLGSPGYRDGWQNLLCGGWVTTVWQSAYGHPACKPTWLYLYGVEPTPLNWRRPNPGQVMDNLSKNRRIQTPVRFAIELAHLVSGSSQ